MYYEQSKNFGFDINLIKVMEISHGDFIWLLGDDDIIAQDGLKTVMHCIQNYGQPSTGLIALANRSYFIDKDTGKETVYFQTVEKLKPKVYQIPRQQVIEASFPNSSFISTLIYNNYFLKKILH